MPGWKTSKASPPMPARKSSASRFGSISVFSSRVKKPILLVTTASPAVWSVSLRAQFEAEALVGPAGQSAVFSPSI